MPDLVPRTAVGEGYPPVDGPSSTHTLGIMCATHPVQAVGRINDGTWGGRDGREHKAATVIPYAIDERVDRNGVRHTSLEQRQQREGRRPFWMWGKLQRWGSEFVGRGSCSFLQYVPRTVSWLFSLFVSLSLSLMGSYPVVFIQTCALEMKGMVRCSCRYVCTRPVGRCKHNCSGISLVEPGGGLSKQTFPRVRIFCRNQACKMSE